MTELSSQLGSAHSENDTGEHRTHQKALRINLAQRIYGTFAEIGAGQEVARWFFRVGGAAGTVAKTMSAYDMQFSDAIYGKGSRYVSRDRIEAMLTHEYGLILERLQTSRGDRTCFFVFADSVSARNYEGSNECHGWLGLRFQADPRAEPNDILLHINLRDNTNLLQQQCLGILGVNLMYGAFFERQSVEGMLKSFFDSLDLNRIEIDIVELRGPEFAEVDPRQISVALLRLGLCRAVAFSSDFVPKTSSEVLHRSAVAIQRGTYQHVRDKFKQMMADSVEALAKELPNLERPPLGLFEVSINSARPDDTPDDGELLRRVEALCQLGYPVIISNYVETFRLTSFLRRFTKEPIRFVVGVGTLVQMMRETFYTEVIGGLLEGLGKLLTEGVKVYVFPMSAQEFSRQLSVYDSGNEFCAVPKGGVVTAKSVTLQGPIQNLYSYLVESGYFLSVGA